MEDDFSLPSLKNLLLSNGLVVKDIEWDLTDTPATAIQK